MFKDLIIALPGERARPGQNFPHNDAYRIHVGFGAPSAGHHLGCHPTSRPLNASSLEHCSIGSFLHGLAQAQVDQDWTLSTSCAFEQNVERLQVAVNNGTVVEMTKTFSNTVKQAHGALVGNLAFLIEMVSQIPSTDVPHNKSWHGYFKKVEDLHHVGVTRNLEQRHEFLFAIVPVLLRLEDFDSYFLFATVLVERRSF